MEASVVKRRGTGSYLWSNPSVFQQTESFRSIHFQELYTPGDDIIDVGSDDDFSDAERARKRHRVEQLADEFLQGKPLFISSMRLRANQVVASIANLQRTSVNSKHKSFHSQAVIEQATVGQERASISRSDFVSAQNAVLQSSFPGKSARNVNATKAEPSVRSHLLARPTLHPQSKTSSGSATSSSGNRKVNQQFEVPVNVRSSAELGFSNINTAEHSDTAPAQHEDVQRIDSRSGTPVLEVDAEEDSQDRLLRDRGIKAKPLKSWAAINQQLNNYDLSRLAANNLLVQEKDTNDARTKGIPKRYQRNNRLAPNLTGSDERNVIKSFAAKPNFEEFRTTTNKGSTRTEENDNAAVAAQRQKSLSSASAGLISNLNGMIAPLTRAPQSKSNDAPIPDSVSTPLVDQHLNRILPNSKDGIPSRILKQALLRELRSSGAEITQYESKILSLGQSEAQTPPPSSISDQRAISLSDVCEQEHQTNTGRSAAVAATRRKRQDRNRELFTHRRQQSFGDFVEWSSITKPGSGLAGTANPNAKASGTARIEECSVVSHNPLPSPRRSGILVAVTPRDIPLEDEALPRPNPMHMKTPKAVQYPQPPKTPPATSMEDTQNNSLKSAADVMQTVDELSRDILDVADMSVVFNHSRS